MRIAVYPGTFDPLTRGHEDLVRRGAKIFDKLVVGVADSPNKKPFFSMDERVQIAREVLSHYPNVRSEGFSRPVERLCTRQQRERDHPWSACGERFRIRVSNGGHEPLFIARCGNHVSDPVRPVPVHFRHYRAGNCVTGWGCQQICVSFGGTLVEPEAGLDPATGCQQIKAVYGFNHYG